MSRRIPAVLLDKSSLFLGIVSLLDHHVDISNSSVKVMADSVFSSPARSWRDVKSTNSLSDSESETYPWECMSMETRVPADITIISGWLKFRDQKKWKLRWGVVTKLSPAADCLHLQLYRDSRDRYKQGLTKASLSLQHFLGLETGFTLDKESNTVAIICQDLIVVLAFDTRERLIQWQVKIYKHLGEDEQYLIQISSSPPKAKLSAGPAKLHIQEHRFCLTISVPPKLVGSWEIKHLRRFGVVDGKFCFEGGSLCGRGEGLYVFLTDQAEEITHHVQLAAEGKLLKTCKRASLSNVTAGQCESPRKSLMLKNASHRITSSQMVNERNATDALRNGSGVLDEHDVRRWPSIETQADLYGHADTSSLTDFAIDSQNAKICNWSLENQLMGRCVSCVGKLGLITRCSTAANTPGSINFNPWSNHDSKLCLDGGTREEELLDELDCSCGAASVSHKSKFSDRSSSGGRTDYSEEHSCCSHSSMENISKKLSSVLAPSSPSPKNFPSSSDVAFSAGVPPGRPPKPLKYRALSEKKISKAPMPLPKEDTTEVEVKSHSTCIRRDCNSSACVENEFASADHLLHKKNMCSNASQLYDTPRNIKKVVNESFANYDVPPPTIHHIYDDCLCIAKARFALRPDDQHCNEECFCHNLSRYPPVWFQLPLHHFQCKNHWPNVDEMTEKVTHTDAKDGPVYAQVDLSKKLKNRLTCTKEGETAVRNQQPLNFKNCINGDSASRCYTHIRFSHNDGNIDEATVNYDRLANLNYMNLEFTNSLRYYENVRELMENRDSSRIDSLNIDLPVNSSFGGGVGGCRGNQRCGCGHASGCKNKVASTGVSSSEGQFENYVPMSPLKTATKHLAMANGTGVAYGRNAAIETLSLDRRTSKTNPTLASTTTVATATATTTTMMMTMMMMITTTTASTATYAVATTTTAAIASGTTSTSTKVSSPALATACNPSPPSLLEKYSTPKTNNMLRHDHERDYTLLVRKRSDSVECGAQFAHCDPLKGSLGDSDSGLESDKLSQENDDTIENLKRRKGTQLLGLRRFASSNGYKTSNTNANRDSSSSNDSGFSTASPKYACNEFSDFEMPLTTATSSAKRHHSFNQRCRKNDSTLPRRSKSSDPLRDLTFHFHKDVGSPAKSSSAEAELPLCLNKQDRCKDCPSPTDMTVSTPYVDCRSTSSGTSDMSDYSETLSLSSHSSADVHSSEAVKLHQSVVTTLKPRSGVEYQKIDRSSLLASQSKF